jgi:hypothetical protein
MIGLAIIGLIVIGSIVAFGIWYLATSITFKNTPNRYEYRKYKDEDGNEITQVIDREDRDK